MTETGHSPDALPIEVWQGDITTLAVDAIVNAANNSLLGGGGVDGAIHRAAGPRLLEYCRTLGGCPTGEARLSPGFELPARWVIHTVGPIWQGGRDGEPALLRKCYDSSFALARSKGVRSMAFPAISCGVYGYPAEQACQIAVAACRDAARDDAQLEQILLVAFDQRLASLMRNALQSRPALR